ncbi:MDR family NADP-dependent oxidoreductase [Mesorhizobium sp. L-8-3]|uniref:MDR family NADP-dependent oxidoreductase n=1 Tax=Mesorhizobium sp. L-8-3 TaxID=2744522 RepID=UPI001927028E|nr:NADP-dependent oxidoreductase [Mesorhizobium sp. L-8-3]BCH23434.1 NADP-dependent oxidoreductase [Mesorhizobium sp. L-8-3]
MATLNRRWIYARMLEGQLSASNFERRDEPAPQLRQGQALVRVRLVSIDPANRLYFAMQAYRPQLAPDDVMAGFGIGEVVESTDPRFRPGDLWHGDFGWQDYAVINSYDRHEYWHRCSEGYKESDLIGVLGITGMTAWFGVEEVLRPQAGETAVVAGATGACGSLIAQLLKLKGCRVIGIGGGPEKCRWLLDELGLDAAVDYRAPDMAAALHAACPSRVQLYSDAVGGDVSRAVLPLMGRGGRWYHFGNLSAYGDARPGAPAERHDSFMSDELRAHCRQEGLKPRFLLVFDHYCRRLEAEAQLARLLQDGRLVAPSTEIAGFEGLPGALIGAGGPGKIGKLNVRISSDHAASA